MSETARSEDDQRNDPHVAIIAGAAGGGVALIIIVVVIVVVLKMSEAHGFAALNCTHVNEGVYMDCQSRH
ncbi:hypothetical protein DPMN_073052, partial [Dreissena polymorpha]